MLSDDILRQRYNKGGYAALDPQYSKYAVTGTSFVLHLLLSRPVL